MAKSPDLKQASKKEANVIFLVELLMLLQIEDILPHATFSGRFVLAEMSENSIEIFKARVLVCLHQDEKTRNCPLIHTLQPWLMLLIPSITTILSFDAWIPNVR